MSPPAVARRDAKKMPPSAGEHAARDIAERDRAPHRDAGVVGGAARAADRRDVPARAQAGQEDVAEDRDGGVDQDDARHAEDRRRSPMKSQACDSGRPPAIAVA